MEDALAILGRISAEQRPLMRSASADLDREHRSAWMRNLRAAREASAPAAEKWARIPIEDEEGSSDDGDATESWASVSSDGDARGATQCAICLDDCDLALEADRRTAPRRAVVITACSHVFHMGCLAECYARDRLSRCPMCRADLAASELVSSAPRSQPSDLEAIMEDEGLRRQIVALVSACVTHAIRWDRRKYTIMCGIGAGLSLAYVSRVENAYAEHLRKLHRELGRALRENQHLNSDILCLLSVRHGPFSFLFGRR